LIILIITSSTVSSVLRLTEIVTHKYCINEIVKWLTVVIKPSLQMLHAVNPDVKKASAIYNLSSIIFQQLEAVTHEILPKDERGNMFSWFVQQKCHELLTRCVGNALSAKLSYNVGPGFLRTV
jgi:hypothetical protein